MTFTLRGNLLKVAAIMSLAIWQPATSAATTDISDTPLPVTSSVAPNILFMLDTSGSMTNIVPDTPFNATVTYLASCASANRVAGGAATIQALAAADTLDVAVKTSDGSVTVHVSGAGGGGSGASGQTWGTGGGQFCFDPTLYYNARLLGNTAVTSNTDCGSNAFSPCNGLVPGTGYLDAIYSGNYLNWYFCNVVSGSCSGAANFGAGANRKPGTQTRLEITKTSATTIVDSLDKVRVGLARYNSVTSGGGGELVVQMAENTTTQKTAVKNAINALSASGNTPLTETLSGIGAYFSTVPSTSTAVNLKLHPGQSSRSPDYLNEKSMSASTLFTGDGAGLRNGVSGTPTIAAPIQYYCQKSFAILMTDGRPQGDQSISLSATPSTAGLCDYLGIIGSCPTSGVGQYGQKGAANGTGADTGYHVNGANKQLHIGGTHTYESAGSDYLDDVAAALYDIDLRPDLTNGAAAKKNNVLTYTIAVADVEAINDPLLQEAATAGGGIFSSAADSATLVTAFQNAADDILAKDGSAAAVAVANAHVTNTDNASYATSYNSGTWTGDLIAYPLNTTTGIPDINAPIWNTGCASPSAYVNPSDTTKGVLGCSAQVQLDSKTSATRKIFTSDDTTTCFTNCGIAFQSASLSSAQLTRLRTSTALADGVAVVAYLRGDKSGETAGTYRARTHFLGDTVNAEPLVIRRPGFNYGDLDYATYKAANATRAMLILQPANDGMVHAFSEQTGVEEWAYIPNLLISKSNDPADSTISLLNTRTRKSFTHNFLIDGTPVTGDVDFANSGTTGVTTTNWGTIAVGGMGKGGRGYYALNLTTTVPTGGDNTAQETNAATKALWEFPRSITNATARASAFLNMGYSFGKPIIVKTRAAGWVVLVTSGYNNGTNSGESGGDGLGHLYVLNAYTGDLIADLKTTGCHATPLANSCGLSSINAYVEKKDSDNTMDLAYGGDLYGNLWRFDLRGTTVAGWTVSKMATLRSGSTTATALQPVTTTPELAKITVSGTDKYMVYVGTGIYLGKTDLPCPPSPATCTWTPNSQSTQTQTMYGLLESRTGAATVESLATLADPLRPDLIAQTYTSASNMRTFTNNAVNLSTKKGWYVDFTGGERLVTDPALAAGTLVFTSNIPSTTACIPGGSSWLYAIDYQTGGMVAGSSWGGTWLGDALGSRAVLIQLPGGAIKAIIRLSDTTTTVKDIPVSSTPATERRVSWRELIDK